MFFPTTSRPLLHSPLFPPTCRPLYHRTNLRTPTRTHIRMSTTSSSSSLIEHIVLFNVKPTTQPTQISTMVESLNTLKNLPMVRHLYATKIKRIHSSELNFTHILHSRYATKQDLANYSAHQDHLAVVRANVLPICDDIMAVDWVAEDMDPVRDGVEPGSEVRVQLIKLKEQGKGKEEVVNVMQSVKEKMKKKNMSVGENFSPERAKGYEIGCLSVVEDAVATESEMEKEKEKGREWVERVLVVDFVVAEEKEG